MLCYACGRTPAQDGQVAGWRGWGHVKQALHHRVWQKSSAVVMTPLEALVGLSADEEANNTDWKALWEQSCAALQSGSASSVSASAATSREPSVEGQVEPVGEVRCTGRRGGKPSKEMYIRTPGGGRARVEGGARGRAHVISPQRTTLRSLLPPSATHDASRRASDEAVRSRAQPCQVGTNKPKPALPTRAPIPSVKARVNPTTNDRPRVHEHYRGSIHGSVHASIGGGRGGDAFQGLTLVGEDSTHDTAINHQAARHQAGQLETAISHQKSQPISRQAEQLGKCALDEDGAMREACVSARPLDRAHLLQEMAKLSVSKKLYLIGILESSEQVVATSQITVEQVTKQSGPDECSSRSATSTKPRDVTPRSPPPQPYPAEVLRVWAKVHRSRKAAKRPSRALLVDKTVDGPSALRARIRQDFTAGVSSKDAAVLHKHFWPETNLSNSPARQQLDTDEYSAVAAFLGQPVMPGYAASPPRTQHGPLHAQSASGSLALPVDDLSRSVLQKLRQAAAWADEHELGNVFKTHDDRICLMPVQEFKVGLSSALGLRLTGEEFNLVMEWFGNGLSGKSAAVDLNLFSQQFWTLAVAERNNVGRMKHMNVHNETSHVTLPSIGAVKNTEHDRVQSVRELLQGGERGTDAYSDDDDFEDDHG